MNLLVTGGAGFIGTNFVRFWLEEYPNDQVVVIDAMTYAGHPDNLADYKSDPRLTIVVGDITNHALALAVMQKHDIETVVHFAAETHVDRSIDDPEVFVRTNVIGTQTLLEAGRKMWLHGDRTRAHRFHHVSTDEVYGSLPPGEPPFSELTAYAPNSPYAASKAASDHLVRAYHRTYGLNATISNCSNNYGPYQLPEKLIPLFIRRLLAKQPVPLYGDGGNIRDWLHVQDHCRGIAAILASGSPGRTYNIGGHNERTNLDVVMTLCRLFDQRFPERSGFSHETLVRFVTDRPGHDRRYAIDPSRMEKELGFRIEREFESGLSETLDWYLTHTEWIEQRVQPLPNWLADDGRSDGWVDDSDFSKADSVK